MGPVIGHASGNNGNSNIMTVSLCRNKHHTWLSVRSCILQQMEISANELKDVLNKVVSKCTYLLFIDCFWVLFFSIYCLQETICYLQTRTYTLKASVERAVEA